MPRIVDRRKRQQEAVVGLWEVIAERGMEAVSVRSVIAQTAWSRGLIDRHFRNFAELIQIGLRTFCEEGDRRAAQARAGLGGEDALRATLLEFVPLDERRRKVGRIWFGFLSRAINDPELGKQMLVYRATHAAHYREILSEMIAAGQTTPRLDVDEAVDKLLSFELASNVGTMLAPGEMSESLLRRRAEELIGRISGA